MKVPSAPREERYETQHPVCCPRRVGRGRAARRYDRRRIGRVQESLRGQAADRDRHAARPHWCDQLLRPAEPGRRADRGQPDQQEGRCSRATVQDHQRRHKVRSQPDRRRCPVADRQGRQFDDPDARLRLRRAVRARRVREEHPCDLRGGRLSLRLAGHRPVSVQPVPLRQRGRDRRDLRLEQGLAAPVRARGSEHQLLEDVLRELQLLVGQAGRHGRRLRPRS